MEQPEKPKTISRYVTASSMHEAIRQKAVPLIGHEVDGHLLQRIEVTSTETPNVWLVECEYRNQTNT
jgi:hypothetical protein